MSSKVAAAVVFCIVLVFIAREIRGADDFPAGDSLFVAGDSRVLEGEAAFTPWNDRLSPRPVLRDLYGNEIETAVGDYRFDPRGELYELHSPDTALPRLAPPEA